MDFISRDEYLELRRQWKEEYMALSRDIHDLKAATREAATGGWSAANRLQSIRARLSNKAFDYMLTLEDLKRESRLAVAFLRFLDSDQWQKSNH